jgi:hypothetical protein
VTGHDIAITREQTGQPLFPKRIARQNPDAQGLECKRRPRGVPRRSTRDAGLVFGRSPIKAQRASGSARLANVWNRRDGADHGTEPWGPLFGVHWTIPMPPRSVRSAVRICYCG